MNFVQIQFQSNSCFIQNAYFMPFLIQLFFEKLLREIRNCKEIFREIIELDKAENRRIK